MVKLLGADGGSAVEAINGALKDSRKEMTRDAADVWFEESQDWLYAAASGRSNIDSEGREGRRMNGLFSIAQSGHPPVWSESDDAWVISYSHVGSVYMEFGTEPHEIEARKAEFLAFEWPDAPQEVQEQFSETEGDMVYFKSINHPGTPAIGFLRRGRIKTEDYLEDRGYEPERFGASERDYRG